MDFIAFEHTPTKSVSAEVVRVGHTDVPSDGGSVSGCDKADFGTDVKDAIALIQRGTCAFTQKLDNALFTDWRTDHPALRRVSLLGISIRAKRTAAAPPKAQVLARFGETTLLYLLESVGRVEFGTTFDPEDSNLPLRVAFPVLLYNAIDYVRDGLVIGPLHVQFVLGVKNALPVRREILDFGVSELLALMPDATWVAAGIGRHQLEVNRWCLEMGGHIRTGLEDNVRWDKSRLAKSNAELVGRAAGLCREFGRPVATPEQARRILRLAA